MIELVASDGYESVTIRKLAGLAGVSTATLYSHYSGKEACALATYSTVMLTIVASVTEVRPAPGGAARQLRRLIRAVLHGLAEDHAAARLALLEVYGAGAPALEQVSLRERELAEALRLTLSDGGRRPVPLGAARWITAGVLEIARTAAIGGQGMPTKETVDPLHRWSQAVLEWKPTGLHALKPRRSRSAEPSTRLPAAWGATRSERELILATVTRLGIAEGYWRLSSDEVRRAAGVSRARLDQHFRDLDECYLEAVERLATGYLDRLLQGPAGPTWPATIRRRVQDLYEAALADRPAARFVFGGILAPGASGMLRRQRLISEYAERLREAGSTRTGRWPSILTLAALWTTLADDLEGDGKERSGTLRPARLLAGSAT